MNNRHKYFRNLRYKQNLESKVTTDRTYWSHVYFITSEPDPRYEREAQWRFYYESKGWPVDEKRRGRNHYLYYNRPEVDYSIYEYHTRSRRSNMNSYFKKYANKIVRQEFKKKGYIYNHSSYKKQFDIKWTLD